MQVSQRSHSSLGFPTTYHIPSTESFWTTGPNISALTTSSSIPGYLKDLGYQTHALESKMSPRAKPKLWFSLQVTFGLVHAVWSAPRPMHRGPFLMCVTFHNVHSPLDHKPDFLALYDESVVQT